MSYSVVLKTVDGITTVETASGQVPEHITVNGHIAEPGTSPPSIYVNDGTLCASSYVVAQP